MATDNQGSNAASIIASLLTGVSGGAAASALSDSDKANDLLVRWLTRKKRPVGDDLRIPVYAGADLNLAHGSGEANMGARISQLLNKHNIGSYYINTNDRHKLRDLTDDDFYKNTWRSDVVKKNGQFWADDVRINGSTAEGLRKLRDIPFIKDGVRSNAYDILAGKIMNATGMTPEQVRQLFLSGKFNNFTPGELYDIFQVANNDGIKNIVTGKAHIVPRATFLKDWDSKRIPYLMTGEAGMNYSTLTANANADRIVGNTYPYPESPRTRNLSLDGQFQANYRSRGDKLIPGAAMYDPGVGRRSRLGRMYKYYAPAALGGGERKAYLDAIKRIAIKNGLDPATLGRRTKYMLISTGAAGANAAEKLRIAAKAFENDKNVRILLQHGKDPAPGALNLDLYTNNGLNEEIARINSRRPGFVMSFGRDDAYKTLARNVNLHGAYAGSSSATEVLSHTNPTVMMGDTHLNVGNSDYAAGRRGYKQVNTGHTALQRLIDSGEGMNTVVNSRDNGMTLGDAIRKYNLQGKNLADLERDAVKTLRDAMYSRKGRFSREAVAGANRMLAEQRQRNTSFIRTMRNAVVNAANRNDTRSYIRKSPGILKNLSWVNRRMFRTPTGRRIGVPLAALSALLLGGGTYAMTKNKAK